MDNRTIQNEFEHLMNTKIKLKMTTANYEYVGLIVGLYKDFFEFEITSLHKRIKIVTHAVISFEVAN
jgi:hypothetical protein